MLETGERREDKRDEQDEAGEERLVEGTDPDKKFDRPGQPTEES